MEERLVSSAEKSVARRQKVTVLLLESNILRSSLGGKSGVLLGILDVDEIDLHALLGLDADDQGRTLAGSDNLMREMDGLDEKTIGTLELGNDGLGQVNEINARVGVV